MIRIPLRPTDPDAPFDLQAVVDPCYRNGGYDDIDYSTEPDPRLKKDDDAWSDALLKQQGWRRSGSDAPRPIVGPRLSRKHARNLPL